jgi:uncharacterized membrane protein
LTVAAKATITWTTIDYPGASETIVNGINNNGGAVGFYLTSGTLHGFLLSGGIFTTIDYPGAYLTNAEGINNEGDIVGTYCLIESPCNTAGFLLHDGIWTTISVPGSLYTNVHGINNNGDIVGEYQGSTRSPIGFVLKAGVYTWIMAPGAYSTSVRGLNDSGDIVGYYYTAQVYPNRGFLLRDGVWRNAGLPRSHGSEINAVNNNKQIAGSVTRDKYGRATVGFARYNKEILILNHTPSNWVWVKGMNDHADMVGYFFDTTNMTVHGFIRTR